MDEGEPSKIRCRLARLSMNELNASAIEPLAAGQIGPSKGLQTFGIGECFPSTSTGPKNDISIRSFNQFIEFQLLK